MSDREMRYLGSYQEPAVAEKNEDGRYGWKKWTPEHLQFLNQPKWALVLMSGICMNQGIVVNGLLHIFVPHIERRFEMSSKELSVIINAYDIGSLLLLMPITYLGSRHGAHRPRIMGHCAIILGTGSLIFSLPAFLTGPYYGEVITNLCTEYPPIVDKEPIPNRWALYSLLFFGNFLHGIGAVPLTTLSVTYLDDSVVASKSSLYLGVFYGMAIVGPTLGVGIGGVFSHYLDVDFLRHINIPEEELLTPDSPRWVGCWWLGFVIFGVLFYPLGALVLGLPSVLKGTKSILEMKKMNSQEDQMKIISVQVPEIKSIRVLPRLLWFVVLDLRFDCLTVAGCCELLLITGLGTHFPKLLEQQFNLDPLMVSISYGVATVPPCLLGLGIGALIMRIYQPSLKTIFLFATCLMSACSVLTVGLVLHCPTHDFDGIHQASERDGTSNPISTLSRQCNDHCNCDSTLYTPVCGFDNVTYFSPCFAGCDSEHPSDSTKFYSNCSCIDQQFADDLGIQAQQGACPKQCNIIYVLLIAVFLYQTMSFSVAMPAVMGSLRCIDVEFHSLALAIQWMCARLLGAIPGPIILGVAIDSSCVYWNYVKGVRGSCLVYDHAKLGLFTALTCFTVKCFQTCMFLSAYLLELKRLNTANKQSNNKPTVSSRRSR